VAIGRASQHFLRIRPRGNPLRAGSEAAPLTACQGLRPK
jgi:hypothetical protein